MFKISLYNIKPLIEKDQQLVTECEDYDCKETILADICEIFEESKKIKFDVIGFGIEKWPVDCMFDLLSVVGELPDIINSFYQNSYDFNLDFYEQGLERMLIFKEKEDSIIIMCESHNKWIPDHQIEHISKSGLVKMILELYNKFIIYTECLCGHLLEHPLMKEFILNDCIINELERKYSV